ncbi:hypothetical protein QBC41DRAFT_395345 [Cercophora samala]|uniref:Uncharacterized protein n=1 Tax=Cercophora samala TaxID=330535 RepID=A0AA39ZB31_9PEZI|nr:hypothetical protein QBC41DRAFT_395345 [Cercophora samala]
MEWAPDSQATDDSSDDGGDDEVELQKFEEPKWCMGRGSWCRPVDCLIGSLGHPSSQNTAKMIPPIDDLVLQQNPEFAALYTTLTTVILNPDASTRKDPNAKKRAAVRKELDTHRLKTAKHHLLINAISTAHPTTEQPPPPTTEKPSLLRHRPTRSRSESQPQPQPPSGPLPPPLPLAQPKPPPLPQSLLDLLLLLPPLLSPNPPIPLSSLPLLLSSPPFSHLPSHLPLLSSFLSQSLHTTALTLTRLAQPNTNPSFLHRSIPSLPAFTLTQLETLHHKKYSLLRSRLSLAASVSNLLDRQIYILSKLIKSLEAKHGPVSRSLEYSAAETALVAQKQELEVKSAGRAVKREVYPPEAATALGNYSRHLRDARSRLGERIKGLEGELGEYHQQNGERDKSKKMKEMARVYVDMGRQLEEVRQDLERLDTA